MSEKQTEAQQLALKLDALSSAKKPYSTGAFWEDTMLEARK